MNGVPGVIVFESHAFLPFSSSLIVLPIAAEISKSESRNAERRTFPHRHRLFARILLLRCFLRSTEWT